MNNIKLPLTKSQLRQHGNALVITMLTVVMVLGLLSFASDYFVGNNELQKVDQDRDQAKTAAESLMTMLEARINALGEQNTSLLKRDIATSANGGQEWFNYWFKSRGFDQGGDNPATTALYLQGCALRWRVEPIKIMQNANASATDSSEPFFVNSERDPDLSGVRRTNAGVNLIDPEAQHLYYLIVVESYALVDPQKHYQDYAAYGDVVLPWNKASWTQRWRNGEPPHKNMVQIQRVIELEDVNPFRYMINYTAIGPTGDLEFNPLTDVDILGAGLRSNGRIFLSSQRNHRITVGNSDASLAVEAPRGIFRIEKAGAYSDTITKITSETIPLLSELNNRFGTIYLNNIPFIYTQDSRTSLATVKTDDGVVSGHKKTVRDDKDRIGDDGKNIPAAEEDVKTYEGWNPGVLDSVQRVGPGRSIYSYPRAGSTLRNPLPADIRTLYSKNHPAWALGRAPDISDASNGAVTLVSPAAAEAPLFTFTIEDPADPTKTITYTDIWPFDVGFNQLGGLDTIAAQNKAGASYQPAVPGRAATESTPAQPPIAAKFAQPGNTGLIDDDSQLMVLSPSTKPPNSIYPAQNDFFKDLVGNGKITGLIIREKGRGMAGPPPEKLADHDAYMRANYVIYLGRNSAGGPLVNISADFFAYSLTNATSIRDLMLHEDQFTNRREQAWYADRGMSNTTENALTLNMEKLLAFLKTTVNTQTLGVGGKYSNYFSDKIYLERNSRMFLDGALIPYFHPLAPDGWCGEFPTRHPFTNIGLAPGILRYNSDPLLMPLAPIVGTVDGGPIAGATVGTASTWTVFPKRRAVRIDKATDMKDTKVSIITPNPCYIWGDFNSATPDDNKNSIIMADSLVQLSNNWDDSKSADTNLPKATETSLRAALITYNVPTDLENASAGGSGGAQNIIRFLEDWTDVNFNYSGSIVVTGRSRQIRSPVSQGPTDQYCRQPNYKYTYIRSLMSSTGQPDVSTKDIDEKRVYNVIVNSN